MSSVLDVDIISHILGFVSKNNDKFNVMLSCKLFNALGHKLFRIVGCSKSVSKLPYGTQWGTPRGYNGLARNIGCKIYLYYRPDEAITAAYRAPYPTAVTHSCSLEELAEIVQLLDP